MVRKSFMSMKCPNCQKELIQVEGKREKLFCNSTCRSNVWAKNKRKATVPEPKKEEPNTPPKIPKNLIELREMCPKNLDSFARAEWTRINRVKYGI